MLLHYLLKHQKKKRKEKGTKIICLRKKEFKFSANSCFFIVVVFHLIRYSKTMCTPLYHQNKSINYTMTTFADNKIAVIEGMTVVQKENKQYH